MQSPESSQGAPRWALAPPQSLWALWGGQAAQHAGRRFPAVAGTQAFREKPFVTTVAHPPSDPRGSLGRVSLFAVIKVFSRGKMVTFFHPEKGGTLANFFRGLGGLSSTLRRRTNFRSFCSVRPSDRPTVRPTVRPSGRPTGRPSVRPTVRPPDRPSVSPPARPTDGWRSRISVPLGLDGLVAIWGLAPPPCGGWGLVGTKMVWGHAGAFLTTEHLFRSLRAGGLRRHWGGGACPRPLRWEGEPCGRHWSGGVGLQARSWVA